MTNSWSYPCCKWVVTEVTDQLLTWPTQMFKLFNYRRHHHHCHHQVPVTPSWLDFHHKPQSNCLLLWVGLRMGNHKQLGSCSVCFPSPERGYPTNINCPTDSALMPLVLVGVHPTRWCLKGTGQSVVFVGPYFSTHPGGDFQDRTSCSTWLPFATRSKVSHFCGCFCFPPRRGCVSTACRQEGYEPVIKRGTSRQSSKLEFNQPLKPTLSQA